MAAISRENTDDGIASACRVGDAKYLRNLLDNMVCAHKCFTGSYQTNGSRQGAEKLIISFMMTMYLSICVCFPDFQNIGAQKSGFVTSIPYIAAEKAACRSMLLQL